jgi:hypothetical protein
MKFQENKNAAGKFKFLLTQGVITFKILNFFLQISFF